jgi:glyoxylase-like metal-dependent hydrolase (beta-lactamase superfamily II)
MSSGVYEVYAIRYGHFEQRAPGNFIGGDPHDVPQPLDYYVWVIRNDDRTFVVDSGFDEARSKLRNRAIVKPVAEGLEALGVQRDAVEDVIVTHLHYDHAGNHHLFPNARYHVQDCEMAYATGRCMCHTHMRLPYEADDVTEMVRKLYAGRMVFHAGSSEVAPGIMVHKIGGHSKGLQCVTVATRRGAVVLASDTVHLYAHIEQGRVFPVVYSVAEVLEGYNTIRRLAPSPRHIIPGHDPLVLKHFPAAKPGLEDWVVRLDADPI